MLAIVSIFYTIKIGVFTVLRTVYIFYFYLSIQKVMRKIYSVVFICKILLLLNSCSVITKTQKESIRDFATSSASFSKMPKEVFDLQKEGTLKYAMLNAITSMSDTADMIEKLDKAVNDYGSKEKFTTDLEITFKLIEKYSAILGKLVNVDIEGSSKESATSLGSGIDSLVSKSNNKELSKIPIGFGRLISKLITGGAVRKLKNKQLVLAREFVTRGDTLIKMATTVLSNLAIEGLIIKDAEAVAKDAKNDFIDLYKHITADKPSTWDMYSDINPKFVDIRLSSAQALIAAKKLQKASEKLVAAHAEVKEVLFKKDSNSILGNIASFTSDVLDARDIVDNIKEAKKKLLAK
jgi:hypothetical protein